MKDRKEYQRDYQLKNREKLNAKKRVYRDANREKINAQQRAYDKANKEKKAAYYLKNKEKIAISDKARYEATKTAHTIVYLLPNEHYVGVTNSLIYRLREHKNQGRDVSDYRILAELDSKEDALELEDLLHQEGYNGARGWQKKKK